MEGTLFLIIFVIVFVLIFAAMVHTHLQQKRKRAEKIAELDKLSFTALKEPPPDVTELLTSLHRTGHRKDLTLRDVYEKRGEGYRVFLYDMFDHSGESVSAVVTAGVAIHSERLSLPLLRIVCRIEGPGSVAGIMKLAMDRLIAMAGTPLDFSQYPGFNQKYYVLGSDEEAIRAVLREPLLELLAEKTWRSLEARGAAFAYDRRDSYDYTAKKKVEVSTREKLQEALELFRALTDTERPEEAQEGQDSTKNQG